MFTLHLYYMDGSRPGQVYPWCEKENADLGKSNGQCGTNLSSVSVGKGTCPYCHWEKLKDIYKIAPNISKTYRTYVHWGIHPVFSRDGTMRLIHWEAQCGKIDIYPEVYFATRDIREVTCPLCVTSEI